MQGALARHDAIRARRGRQFMPGRWSRARVTGSTPRSRLRMMRSTPRSRRRSRSVAEPWGVTGPLRVRMGLHAGEATERDGDWFGSDVNRAARVMAVAHGGQVAVHRRGRRAGARAVRSWSTSASIGSATCSPRCTCSRWRCRARPASFPPLRSLDAYRSNLPYELSSFVGREEELRTIADRMRSTRVVSIVGVGGVGKTRLALQVGSELLPHYPDGVWLCELAQVLDPDDLPDAVAAAVGYVPPQGVSVAEGLPRFLERKDLLLVLDNCEHLVGAVAAFVAATTAHAARVSVLATSREALGVRGEHISPLASLAVPVAADADVGAGLRGGRVVRRPRQRSARRAGAGRHQRAGGPRPVRAPRRDPPRDRARRGADEDDDAERDPHPARPAVPALDRRSAHAAWSATRRCGPRSTGPTTCSATTSGRCSPGCRCAWVASISMPRPRSRPVAARTSSRRSSCSRRWSPSRSWSAASATVSPATDCWR